MYYEQEKFNEFIHNFNNAYQKGLPGEMAQKKMMPEQRKGFTEYLLYKENAKKSAVNVIIYQSLSTLGIQLNIALMQRNEYDGHHSGQISFPGGKIEHSDPTPWSAALRETTEELGIPKDVLKVIGPLTELYIPPSNFWVYPYISYSLEPVSFYPSSREVKEIIPLSLKDLLSDQNVSSFEYFLPNGGSIVFPCFKFNQRIVWGATAIVLNEVKEIILSI